MPKISCIQKGYRAYVEALIGQENRKKIKRDRKKNIQKYYGSDIAKRLLNFCVLNL